MEKKNIRFMNDKKDSIIYLLFVLILLFNSQASAQGLTQKWNTFEKKEQIKLSDELFLNSKYFHLEKDNEMIKYKEYDDKQGNTHAKYFQTYKGIKIEGGHYILHYLNDDLYAMNGNIVSQLQIDDTQQISEEQAVNIVLNRLVKENSFNLEYEIKKPDVRSLTDKDKQLRGSLIITEKGDDKKWKLCYKFNIELNKALESYDCYVDVKSGEIISIESSARHCTVGTATGTTRYNGSQYFTTKWGGSLAQYELIDDCRNIRTKHAWGWFDYHDGTDNWVSSNDIEGVSVHWALQRAFDYYEFAFNLAGVDGFYMPIEGRADANGTYSNQAAWSNGRIFVGGDNGSDISFATLDVIGHEWTHGVDQHSGPNLTAQDESGALKESFADIFGAMVEYYVEGMHSGIYVHGDDHGKTSALESFQDPGIYDAPSIYEGLNWHDYTTNTNDFGGIHTNRGVQNHWFYLLAEGGSQTVDGVTYNVTGIGIENAAYVTYKNFRDYLSESSEYNDSKNGSILAAIDIWGECDWKVEQVINAWNAVGVSSVGGKYFNHFVDCNEVQLSYSLGNTYGADALNDINSDCLYSAGEISRLVAGNQIRFLAGSILSGDLRASINSCLTNNMRVSSNLSSYAGLGNIEVDFQNELSVPNVTINPNPSSGIFSIKVGENFITGSMKVYNSMGVKVYEKNDLDEFSELNLDQYSSGIYILSLRNGERIFTKKLIKD